MNGQLMSSVLLLIAAETPTLSLLAVVGVACIGVILMGVIALVLLVIYERMVKRR